MPLWPLPFQLTAEPLVPVRAWQFHTLDMPYVLAGLKLAPAYDINTVVFSHELIGYASELFQGTERGRQLKQLTAAAHAEKLKAWIWVREFESVPPQFMSGGLVQMDRPDSGSGSPDGTTICSPPTRISTA